jgi:hypothetical protein
MDKLSLVLQFNEPEPEESLKNYVLERYYSYLDVFTEKEAIPLLLHWLWDHVVTLICYILTVPLPFPHHPILTLPLIPRIHPHLPPLLFLSSPTLFLPILLISFHALPQNPSA